MKKIVSLNSNKSILIKATFCLVVVNICKKNKQLSLRKSEIYKRTQQFDIIDGADQIDFTSKLFPLNCNDNNICLCGAMPMDIKTC